MSKHLDRSQVAIHSTEDVEDKLTCNNRVSSNASPASTCGSCCGVDVDVTCNCCRSGSGCDVCVSFETESSRNREVRDVRTIAVEKVALHSTASDDVACCGVQCHFVSVDCDVATDSKCACDVGICACRKQTARCDCACRDNRSCVECGARPDQVGITSRSSGVVVDD